jgi:hypothetical protein
VAHVCLRSCEKAVTVHEEALLIRGGTTLVTKIIGP